MFDPALFQDLCSGGVVRRRPLDLPERDASAQARYVSAEEVAAQVGGGEQELPGRRCRRRPWSLHDRGLCGRAWPHRAGRW